MNAKLARALANSARQTFDQRLDESWGVGTKSQRMAVERLRAEAVDQSREADYITLGEYADKVAARVLGPVS